MPCLPNIQPPTTPFARASLSQSSQRARLSLTQGFATNEEARRAMTPNRDRHPAGCSFASSCSPPHLSVTQLPSATCDTTPHRMDFHLLTRQHHRRTHPRESGDPAVGTRRSADVSQQVVESGAKGLALQCGGSLDARIREHDTPDQPLSAGLSASLEF